MNLGIALSALAIFGSSNLKQQLRRLRIALRAYNAASLEQSFERNPSEWAKLKTNIGIALSRLGVCERRVDLLQDALCSLQAALAVFEGKSELDAQVAWRAIRNTLWNIDAIKHGRPILLEGATSFLGGFMILCCVIETIWYHSPPVNTDDTMYLEHHERCAKS